MKRQTGVCANGNPLTVIEYRAHAMSDKRETPHDVLTAPEPTTPIPPEPAPDLNRIRQTPDGTEIRVSDTVELPPPPPRPPDGKAGD